MATLNSPEKGLTLSNSVETQKLIVTQPAKLAELNDLLLTFESFSNKISERTGEDRSGDMGGGSGSGTGQKGDDDGTQVSPRDQAIANIPVPAIMQKQLKEHIEKEVHDLTKTATRLARSSQPGTAYRVNELYARIRRLNSLIGEILEASYEVLKRLFIRVFIDKQTVL